MCDKSFNQSIKEIKDATVQLNRLYIRLRNIVIFFSVAVIDLGCCACNKDKT